MRTVPRPAGSSRQEPCPATAPYAPLDSAPRGAAISGGEMPAAAFVAALKKDVEMKGEGKAQRKAF